MRHLDDIEDVVKQARDAMEALDRQLDEILPQYGPGFRAPRTDELPAFLAAKREEFPPQEWLLPDGRVVHESIYLLALPYVEGGEEILRKVLRITEGAA